MNHRILIACEESGIVRDAFIARGFDAWSCDILPRSHPKHISGDVLPHLGDGWDMMIAHPPCTDICLACARYWKQKRADGRQQAGIDFFMAMANAPIERIAVENPVGVMSRVYRKPDQIINPWQFGDEAHKPTCLWLKGLPLLIPTKIVGRGEFYEYNGRRLSKWNHNRGHGPERARIASKTFQGIADAMAQQWGDYLRQRDASP